MVLLAVADAVDDTKLVGKAILGEMADNMQEVRTEFVLHCAMFVVSASLYFFRSIFLFLYLSLVFFSCGKRLKLSFFLISYSIFSPFFLCVL